MDAAAYVRVSTPAQNYELQVSAIERAARARGDVITVVYSDKETGTILERPDLRRLRTDARRGEMPRRLYVFALDRLTRTGIVDTIATLKELHQVGVEVISYTESFDLAGPHAEPIIACLAWCSMMEVKRQQERRAAKRAAMEARGGHWGRPRKTGQEKKEKMVIRTIAALVKMPPARVQRVIQREGGVSKVRGTEEPVVPSDPV